MYDWMTGACSEHATTGCPEVDWRPGATVLALTPSGAVLHARVHRSAHDAARAVVLANFWWECTVVQYAAMGVSPPAPYTQGQQVSYALWLGGEVPNQHAQENSV